MKFSCVGNTDVGIRKETNQDSILIKHASTDKGEVVLAVICDGMGGLSKGELASATVIRAFADWFDTELPYELNNLDMNVIGSKWDLMLNDLNIRIIEYSQQNRLSMGTTFTGVLFVNDMYLIGHVGDTRAYFIGDEVAQLTKDQTVIARELELGNITLQEAETDKRRNMLLQCVGASKTVSPQIISGKTQRGVYMLCSDGFRHKIDSHEMYKAFNPEIMKNRDDMNNSSIQLIETVKNRGEQDNISVVLVKVD